MTEPSSDAAPSPVFDARKASSALLGRGSIYAVVTVLQSASAFLVLPILSRELGPHEYGVVATCFAVYQLLLVIAPLGLNSVVPWAFYERGQEGLDVSRRLAATTLLIAAAVVAVVHASGPLWSNVLENVPYSGALVIAVLTVVPGVALVVAQGLLQAQARPAQFAVCTLLSVVGGQVAGLVLVVATDGGAGWYFTGLAAGTSTAAVVGFLLTRLRPWRLVGRGTIARSLAFGGPTALHSAAFIVLASGDRVVIERLLGLDDAGRYHVAYLVGAVGLSGIQALNFAWAPMVYSAPEAERWELLASTTSMMQRIALLVAGGIAIGAPLPLALLLPDTFDPAGLTAVCAIVAACVVPQVTYLSGVHVVFRLRKTLVLAWTTPLAGVVNIALNLALIPMIGLVGSALSTLLSYVLWAALVRGAARRAQPVPWNRRFERKSYMTAGALVAVGAVLPAGGSWMLLRGVASLVLLAILVKSVATSIRGMSAVRRRSRASPGSGDERGALA